ncbi:MAG: flagellar hook-basal body complex protein [Rhodobacteraceae bacterium]|nr:flagellar hook-basal body complex protein [Paracoccaceae bacterium]
MDNSGYVTLTRQSGLMAEMQAVAHNIANLSTTGYRREGVIFSEFVAGTGEASLSMARAHGRSLSDLPGALARTGGSYDFAIDGPGFFLVETPGGPRLTRAGAFFPDPAGALVTADGHTLLDAGGAPVFVPADGGEITLGPDGTLAADGVPVAQVGLWQPADPAGLRHEAGVLFDAPDGVEPLVDGRMVQGALEGSNVEPVTEVARMIAVQRAYELGQSLLDREDERIRNVIRTFAR